MKIVGSPMSIKNMTIKNRFLRSATMENMANEDGIVTDDLLRLYYDLALGGVGLIISGACAVEQKAKVWNRQLAAWSDQHIEGLAKIARMILIHGDGSKSAVQLHHGGMGQFGYSYGAQNTHYSLKNATETEIWDVINAFGEAALRVKRAGFDAVAVHGAHGYLISQFLSPISNNRTDSWGGNLKKRIRFVKEICYAIREKVGDDMPLLWKLNCADFHEGGQEIEDYTEVAKNLVNAGVDLIELSGGLKDQIKLRAKLKKKAGTKEAYFRDAVKPFRREIGKSALAITGGIRSLNVMEELLDEGLDLVGLCRPLICEPNLPKRFLKTADKRTAKCTSCNKCLLRIAQQPLKCVEFDEFDRIVKSL
jgi:2,4-dienoyl-CoA reductase-like NADH-dependent reductase (Old Yellow Enzyme family)